MKKISKRNVFTIIGTIVCTIIMFSLFSYYKEHQTENITLSLDIESEVVDGYQVYYDVAGNKEWSEVNSSKNTYSTAGKKDDLKFIIPIEAKNIRIDFGNAPKNIKVSNIFFKRNGKINLDFDELNKLKTDENEIDISQNNEILEVEAKGNDSYIVLSNIDNTISPILTENKLIDIGLAILSLLLGFLLTSSLLSLKKSLKFIKSSFDNKDLIKSLAVNDFKSKYVSSYLGIIWAFINPLITIAVYWFVFQIGFRSGDVGDVPYILWFISGIIPWFFFSEALPSATNSFIEYSYLVKKVLFKIEILPTVKILSAVFVHLFFVLFLFVVMIVYRGVPEVYSFQFIYYSFAMMCLVFAISVFTSSVILFFRDLGQIIGIIVSVGFWATPIGWQLGILPVNIGRIFKLNPMYYIVTGYRDSFIDNIFIWQRPYETIYFWLFCIVVFSLGVKIFYKLKPHFSDVL